MDTIRIELEGERIVLSFRREVGDIRKVRCLSREEATGLGLLLTADPPECRAINLDVTSDVSVQIVNAPYEEAFLFLRDLRGGRTLIVCIEGRVLKQVGQRLLHLGQSTPRSPRASSGAFVRHVSHCYFEDAGAEQ
ncbi:hypothetical protein [Parerythrobacter lacustris]|uniref:STAS domain-containing protein n=1 Tax=Parerythrobacter lacustris TaxID=2969984 RepID=A0ABT1XR42_9SPHN|nr:hypothetical protein [Parerythrobacter lacustris]MCR2834123.1 hypothetical protein [Parerythrobacter lacustris]